MSKESVEFGKTHQQHDDFFKKQSAMFIVGSVGSVGSVALLLIAISVTYFFLSFFLVLCVFCAVLAGNHSGTKFSIKIKICLDY